MSQYFFRIVWESSRKKENSWSMFVSEMSLLFRSGGRKYWKRFPRIAQTFLVEDLKALYTLDLHYNDKIR